MEAELLPLLESTATSVAFCAVLASGLGYTWRAYRQPYLGWWATFWALYVPVWTLAAVSDRLDAATPLWNALRAVMMACSYGARTALALGVLAYLGRPRPRPRTLALLLGAILALTAASTILQSLARAGVLPAWAPLPLRTYFLGLFLQVGLAAALLAAPGANGSARRVVALAIATASLSDALDVVLELAAESPWSSTGAVARLSDFVAHFCDAVFAAGMMTAAIGTERERAERTAEELRARDRRLQEGQRQQTIGQLAGGVAHDFNNLLTAVLAHLSFVRDAVPAGSQARADVDTAAEAAERAARLTRQLLAFARRQPVAPRLVDANAVLAALDRMAAPLLGSHVERRLELTPSPWPVLVDPTQLEQVVLNLVVNARDAMRSGGTLTIETANVLLAPGPPEPDAAGVPEGAWLRLSVEDTGHGMDEPTRARIFEPFFTTKPPGQGSGLGLPAARGIVEQARGHVTVRSLPGRGTRVSVYLPRAAIPPSATPAAPDVVEDTILVVDPEPEVRAAALGTLVAAGWQVREAADGGEALRVAEGLGARLALAVTDVAMPGLDGRELAAELRARRPGLPVLFTSGYEPGTLGGTSPLLRKPFSAGQLADAVARLVPADERRA